MFCARCGQQIPDASEVCPLCGQPPSLHLPPPPVQQEVPVTPAATVVQKDPPIDPNLKGIRGWLAFFCIAVAVISPLTIIASTFSTPFEPWKLLDLLIAAFSITVGVLIMLVHRVTIPVLRGYFIFMAAIAVLGIVGSVVGPEAEDQANASSLLESVRTLFFVAIWGTYFHRSERVRATFGRNLWTKARPFSF